MINIAKPIKKYGLVGFPLGHSFSPPYYKKRFEELCLTGYNYYLLPIENPENLRYLRDYGFSGYNVTIPHKTTVIPCLDHIDTAAAAINAVNCIKIENGEMIGYNTDYYGFKSSLLEMLQGEMPEMALILGDGASSKTVAYVLEALGINFVKVARKLPPFYHDLDEKMMLESRLIINTTPVGMYPKVDQAPNIPYQYISEKHFLFDLVYNPAKSLFLRRGLERGAKCENGLKMLHLQAEKSLEIWGLI